MRRTIAGGVLIVAAVILAAGGAQAGGKRTYKVWRSDAIRAPIKDCTRINGRYGYYGNPWCTPQEQARFDRWGAGQRWWR